VCLKSGTASGSASRRPRKCLVNTAQIAFLNKIHSRQLANPQEIRPAAEKFNEFLAAFSVFYHPNTESFGRVLRSTEIDSDWQSLPFPRREATIKNPNIRDAFFL
jgi:hypothetical protein